MIRRRGGFALLAALWLVVAMTTVGLQFSLDARERRMMGLGAADRARARAAIEGGLAVARARLEEVLRQQRVGGGDVSFLRASDPWLDADSLFQDTITVGGFPLDIHVEDLGAWLNVNTIGETGWRAFLGYVLRDFTKADEIAQAVADWVDPDELPRARGGERDRYLAEERLILPPNRPMRDANELLDVRGMTPEIFEQIRPFLIARGTGRVNPNSAPVEVLRALPGMTDDVLLRIASFRSANRRIRSLQDVLPGVSTGRTRGGNSQGTQMTSAQRQLSQRLTFQATELNVEIGVGSIERDVVMRLHAIVFRSNNNQTTVTWENR